MVTLRWVVYRCWESQVNLPKEAVSSRKKVEKNRNQPALTDRQYLNSRNPGKVPNHLVVLVTLKLTWIMNVTVLVQINDPTSSHIEAPCLCGWRDVSAAQSTSCSCRASGLGSQHPHGGSSFRWPDSLFCPHPALHTSGTYTYMDTNMQTYKIHNKPYKCSVKPHIIFYIFATKYLFYALIHSCRTDIPIVLLLRWIDLGPG